MKSKILILIVFAIALQPIVISQKKFKFTPVANETKKKAKKYESEGWAEFMGKPPLSQQLNSSYTKQAEVDEQGFPKWIIGNGMSVSQSEAAGLSQAMDLAKINLVGMIETNMSTVVETDVANNQISSEEAISITKTIQVSKNMVSKKLGPVLPVFSAVRQKGKNYEIQVMIAYNYEMVRKMMIEEMKIQFQKETDEVRKKYEDFLNPEKYNNGEIVNYTETPATRK